MNLQPMSPYFYIRISKKEQVSRREKIGSIYLSPSHVFMTRELQSGEIVSIGEDAHVAFPEAKVGDTLIIHHFVSGKEWEGTDDSRYHVHSDENFNYYIVTAFSINGRQNETYGVWNGKDIIPHPDFIFLEDDEKKETVSADEFIDKKTEKKGSLLVFKEWSESREERGKKMQELKLLNQELARTTRKDQFGNEYIPDEVKKKIEENEREMDKISASNNKKRYLPYKVAWPNSTLSEQFGEPIQKGDIVYCLNIAANTKVEFMGINYRLAKINYIECTENWVKHSLHKYKSSFNKELM